MSDEKDKKELEDEILIIDEADGGKIIGDVGEERIREPDEDTDDEEDVTSKDGESPDERAARRREERKKRKERQRRAEAENKRELEYLRQHNEELANRLSSVETHTLNSEARNVDGGLIDAQRRYEYAEQQYAEAIARGDGIGATKARRAQDEASAHYNELRNERARLVSYHQYRQQPPPQQQPQGPDPRVVAKANEFIAKNKWIDPTGDRDEDSSIARAIDLRLQKEDFDPTTNEYWDELQKRLKERLPHRYNGTYRSGPPMLNGSDRSSSTKKTFRLSAERKAAMQSDGTWDDPVRRQKMVQAYAKYDLEHPQKS